MALTTVAMVAFAANSLLCRAALASGTIDPATFTVVRIAAGAVTLAAICRWRSVGVGGTWLGAVALCGYAACFSFAYISLTAATGALLLFGSVQATMLVSGMVHGERLQPLQWVGFLAAIGGFIVLMAPGIASPQPTAAVLMIAAGVSWGIYSLIGRGSNDPLGTTAGNFVRAVPMALTLLVAGQTHASAAGLLWAALSGAIASGIGYAIWYAVLPALSATRAATIQLSVPVITAFSGALLLGEPLTLRILMASMAILGGIACVIGWRRP